LAQSAGIGQPFEPARSAAEANELSHNRVTRGAVLPAILDQSRELGPLARLIQDGLDWPL
jgi:hypothetical protein